MKLSIVIPCYDEAENIPIILEKFSNVLCDENIEVILVDNGSLDNTAEVIKTFIPKYNFAKTVSVTVNQGYGYGILQGFKVADGDFIGWTHADMQTDPGDVVKAWKIVTDSPEKNLFVKGNRMGRPLLDRFFSFGMGCFESMYFGMFMSDINAQPNIFPRDFYLCWNNPPYDFSLDLYVMYTARRQGLKVVRFPVLFPKRIHGHSKWNTGIKAKWKFIKRTLQYSRKLKHQIYK